MVHCSWGKLCYLACSRKYHNWECYTPNLINYWSHQMIRWSSVMVSLFVKLAIRESMMCRIMCMSKLFRDLAKGFRVMPLFQNSYISIYPYLLWLSCVRGCTLHNQLHVLTGNRFLDVWRLFAVLNFIS